MNVENIGAVVSLLRQRLQPAEHAQSLISACLKQQPQARLAAVLLALFAHENEPHLIFIRRASTLRSHSGEIAFPGGGAELSDTSPIATALREAHEEIGLDPALVDVLGVLSPVFTVVSNFIVLPVVAYLPNGPGTLHLQASEVTELIDASLRGLLDPTITHTEQWQRNNIMRTVYFYDYGPHRIWGATARMLNLLLVLLGDHVHLHTPE